jgi:hypothetical protein
MQSTTSSGWRPTRLAAYEARQPLGPIPAAFRIVQDGDGFPVQYPDVQGGDGLAGGQGGWGYYWELLVRHDVLCD